MSLLFFFYYSCTFQFYLFQPEVKYKSNIDDMETAGIEHCLKNALELPEHLPVLSLYQEKSEFIWLRIAKLEHDE